MRRKPYTHDFILEKRAKGFEPSTSALGRLHSTTELRPQWTDEIVSCDLNRSNCPLVPKGTNFVRIRISCGGYLLTDCRDRRIMLSMAKYRIDSIAGLARQMGFAS